MRAVSILGAMLAVLALSALLAGCARPAPDEDSPAAGWHVEQADAAGGATLAVRLDRSRITTAEWVLLEVEVAAAEGRVVQFPAAAALQKGSLRVERTQTLQPELLDSGLVRWVRRFELQPFLAGDYAVPGLTIAVADAAGGETRLRSEPIPVTVVSVLDPAETTARPREVAAPVAVAPRPGHVALLGGIALAAAVGAAALIVVLRRRAARMRARGALVPPDQAALSALRDLAAGDLPERDLLAFHHAVATVVRTFLELRFGVRAPERTTEELMLIVAEVQWLDDVQRRSLHAFLARCDQVKFAGARPAAAVSRGLIDSAVDLVTALRPEPAQERPEEAAVAV